MQHIHCIATNVDIAAVVHKVRLAEFGSKVDQVDKVGNVHVVNNVYVAALGDNVRLGRNVCVSYLVDGNAAFIVRKGRLSMKGC